MKAIFPIDLRRVLAARIFYGWVLIIFLVEGINHRLLHQLLQPVLINPGSDNTYWLLHLLNIPQCIAGSAIASIIFECLLIGVTIFSLLFTKENRWSLLFTLLLAIYLITKNSYVAHHEHGWNGPLMMSFIFWVRNEARFTTLLKAFRYYVLFVFVSAAMWKMARVGIFLPFQFSEILKEQHLGDLTQHPGSTYSKMISWIIVNADAGSWILIVATFLQLSFIVGFFTYRFDSILLWLFFAFFIGDYVLMNLSFYEWYVCAIVFLPWKNLRLDFSAHKEVVA